MKKRSGSDKIALSGNELVLIHLKPHTTYNITEIELITSAFNNYVRIKKIREVYIEISSNKFQFINVNKKSVKNEVLKLNTKN